MATITTGGQPPSAPDAEPGAAPGYRLYRMSAERYNRLIETGALGPDDPVFLWNGLLVEKMPKGRPHVVAQNRVYKRLDRLVPEGWFAEQDQPFEIGERSVPEPDVKVVRGTQEDYLTRNPTPRDVWLVVEIASSTLGDDTGEQLRAYAASVPVYWVVNLKERRIEVYEAPSGPAARPAYGSAPRLRPRR
jgi:Uma2 family endonuclease